MQNDMTTATTGTTVTTVTSASNVATMTKVSCPAARSKQSGATDSAEHHAIRIHRTWCFWSFLLIPVLVAVGWSQYVSINSQNGALPWLGILEGQHGGHWSEWMRYYIWLQLVWLPANMVIFLIWCALGVRIWNYKRHQYNH